MAMKRAILIALLSLVVVPTVAAKRDASVAAVQKVIQMLQEMAAKAKQEKNDEEVAFGKFSMWCNMEKAELEKNIQEGQEQAESLTASIAKLTSDAKTLGEEIEQLQRDIAEYEAEKKETEEQRVKDHAAFIDEQRDYSESVSALERAIQVLSDQDYDRTALLQVNGKKQKAKEILLQVVDRESLPTPMRNQAALIATMLGGQVHDPLGGMDYEAPEANAYEFQSGGIVDVLKNLLSEFTEKLGQCQKEEANSLHAANMIIQDLVDSIENAHDDIASKTKTKAEKEAQCAEDKKMLASTLEVLAQDQDTLRKMTAECEEKTLSYNEKNKLRAEEIEAIEQAIEVLSSDAVSGGAERLLDLQQRSATSLLQMGRRDVSVGASKVEGVRHRAREFLTQQAEKLHSHTLSMIAERLRADPFAKVKKLIDGMITRMLEEANADATREGWCDKEIGENKVTRNKLSEDIDGLNADCEEGKATITSLTAEIAQLTQEIADLNAAMAEATNLREDESAKNKATIEDSQEAQQAVLNAIAILKDFYEKAALATAFVQGSKKGTSLAQFPHMGSDEWNSLANPNFESKVDTIDEAEGFGTVKVDKGHKEGMQTFGETYKGNQDSAGAVLALLDSCLSDFSNVEADTKAAETMAQQAYDAFMIDSKRSVSVKTKKNEMCTNDRTAAEAKLVQDTKDLKATQDELLAADRVYEKLVPQCIEAGVTYDERVKQRESEIQSLREALSILSSADIATSA